MEEQKKSNKSVAIVLILAVLFAGVGVFVAFSVDKEEGRKASVSNSPASSTPTSVFSGSGVEITYDESETIDPGIPIPDLNREPVFGPFAVSPAKENGASRIVELQTALRENHLDFYNWIELGLTFSSLGDHEAAIEAYTYAAALRPKSFLPHANIGFVYGWHLGEPEKAEAAYKKALEINPGEWYVNYQIFEFYRDVLMDKAKAKAFAEAQSEALPQFALDFAVLIKDLERR